MSTPHKDQLLKAASYLEHSSPDVAAMLQRMASPYLSAVLVEGFARVALGKLNDLQGKGFAISGVSIASCDETGHPQHGAVTTGGRVLWWNKFPSQDQDIADLIAGELQVSRGTAYELMRKALAEQQTPAAPIPTQQLDAAQAIIDTQAAQAWTDPLAADAKIWRQEGGAA